MAIHANDDRCWDCRLAAVGEPSPSLPPQTEGEVAYEVADWTAHARVVLTNTLADRGIRCRWEPGLLLVVSEADDEVVEELLDELEDEEPSAMAADADGYGGNGSANPSEQAGADAQAAMGDLFVAADRLMHEPWDEVVGDDLFDATEVVEQSDPPFGIAPESWAQITELAAVVRDDLDTGAAEEVVVQDARTLREVLRHFV